MVEKWTGDLVGAMHNEGVKQEELARELGVGKSYLSMILHGKKTPKDAEKRLNDAFRAILAKREA